MRERTKLAGLSGEARRCRNHRLNHPHYPHLNPCQYHRQNHSPT
jgi:hypothetical protein